MNSLTKYRHPASDPIASKILSMRRQLEVYKGLRFYETVAGKKRIYHLLKGGPFALWRVGVLAAIRDCGKIKIALARWSR